MIEIALLLVIEPLKIVLLKPDLFKEDHLNQPLKMLKL